ncbi:MAG: succinylglutamate desuccinylase [Myxococcales bacterium]
MEPSAWGAATIAGVTVNPGERTDVDLHVGELYTAERIHIPCTVIRGAVPGPTLLIVAAVHGDELNGVATVRALLYEDALALLRGTLLLVPVANVYGFLHQSRTMPDQRDLNRHFPGSAGGSGASRVAHRIMSELVVHADYVIDLHTAGRSRDNLPHVRADLRDPRVAALARAFGCDVILAHAGHGGSLRHAATAAGIPTVTYEAGEPLKFQRPCIDIGARGCRSVMADLGMIRGAVVAGEPLVVSRSSWVRADRGGILDLLVGLGQGVSAGEPVAVSSNPFGKERTTLVAPMEGIVLGRTSLPMVNPGDAVCCIAA